MFLIDCCFVQILCAVLTLILKKCLNITIPIKCNGRITETIYIKRQFLGYDNKFPK